MEGYEGMIELQKFLRANSAEKLAERFDIRVNRHPTYPNLVCFKYHHIKSPRRSKICQQARGIVLDEDNDWAIVARPFDRFFNLGETGAAIRQFNFRKLEVTEKIDGSCLTSYYYDGKWHVASSALPDASGVTGSSDKTFHELFSETWFSENYLTADFQNRTDCSFVFELATLDNRVVIPYDTPQLTLLAVRSNVTGEYLDTSLFNFKRPKTYTFTSLTNLDEILLALPPTKHEGFVVFDGKDRVKIKHPGFVAIHHVVSSLNGEQGTVNERPLIKLVRMGEIEEFLAYYPKYTQAAKDVERRYYKLRKHLRACWKQVEDIKDIKEFAKKLKSTNCLAPGIIFGKKRKGQSIDDQLSTIMRLKNLQKLLTLVK